MRIITYLLIAFLLSMTACQRKYDRWSDQAMHSKARTLTLRARYAFYLDVYNNTMPARTTVAEDIAALGDIAWDYTLHKATSGGYYDALDPAIPVLIAFNRRCSASEYRSLTDAAQKVASDKRRLRLTIGQIGIACGLVHGTTLRDYEKAYPTS